MLILLQGRKKTAVHNWTNNVANSAVTWIHSVARDIELVGGPQLRRAREQGVTPCTARGGSGQESAARVGSVPSSRRSQRR
jgi:hypothetical protein